MNNPAPSSALVRANAPRAGLLTDVVPGVYRVTDTCHTYVIATGLHDGERTAVTVDFGDGTVLDHLCELGIDRVTHVLMTHHHRDQGQGLQRAVDHGARIVVPPAEQELFDDVERFWAGRSLVNDYVMTTERDCLTASVPVSATAPPYGMLDVGVEVWSRPTPGHTPGSFTYQIQLQDRRLAFTGDLIAAPGKVQSLAALQWTYTGFEGAWMTMSSCLALQRDQPDLLLPSHGEPIHDPQAALDALVDGLEQYVDMRRPSGTLGIRDRFAHPYQQISEHLLANRSSESNSYVLVSATGNALVIDYGYDMSAFWPYGGPRYWHVLWAESLPALASYGVARVEVALPTHYHDDHVASMNLLRDAYGTQLWIPENVAPILAQPGTYDLPCQTYQPIAADRVLELGVPFSWHEYTITPYPTPGHTLFAAGYLFEVDAQRWFASGDQTDGRYRPSGPNGQGLRETFNYQYRNMFRLDDFVEYAALLRKLAPRRLLTGHWGARDVDDDYVDMLDSGAAQIVDLHGRLLPPGNTVDSRVARIVPYHLQCRRGDTLGFRVEVCNPSPKRTTVAVTLAGRGVRIEPSQARMSVAAAGTATLDFEVAVEIGATRIVLTADVTVGEVRFGQHAEAVVDVRGD